MKLIYLPSKVTKGAPQLPTLADDLVATGGTLIAACDLLSSVGATIVECACMVELKMLGGYAKLQAKHPGVKVMSSNSTFSEDKFLLLSSLRNSDVFDLF